MSGTMDKHPVEARDSWETYQSRWGDEDESGASSDEVHRSLKNKHHHSNDHDLLRLDQKKEQEYWATMSHEESRKEAKAERKKKRKHTKKMKDLYNDPGIAFDTVHGLMVSVSFCYPLFLCLIFSSPTHQYAPPFAPAPRRSMLVAVEVECTYTSGTLVFSTTKRMSRRLCRVGGCPSPARIHDGLID